MDLPHQPRASLAVHRPGPRYPPARHSGGPRTSPSGSASASSTDLTEAGYVIKEKEGRRNRYQVQEHLPVPEAPDQEQAIGEVLSLMTGRHAARKPKRRVPRSRPGWRRRQRTVPTGTARRSCRAHSTFDAFDLRSFAAGLNRCSAPCGVMPPTASPICRQLAPSRRAPPRTVAQPFRRPSEVIGEIEARPVMPGLLGHVGDGFSATVLHNAAAMDSGSRIRPA